ncbi:MAG: hypothetical protein K2X35_11820 [Bryobacteraceae bacterium]|nr:hypothetical protein [Bryobacteraceae bacterium]
MLPDLEITLRLQSLDLRIGELEKEVASLPKHIAAIEKTLDSHVRRLEADQAALAANQKERKKLDGDIQVLQQKISKFRDQMMGAKTNEQYRAFQHEIDFVEKEIRKAEDRILELMTQSEPLETAVKKAEADLKVEKAQVEAEKAKARERTEIDQAEVKKLREERGEAVARMAKQVHTLYERLRVKKGGVAIAEVTEGRCSACQMALRPQYFQELRRSERVMTCESCGRIIFYNPPVSFVDMSPVQGSAKG